ncbi:MAG: hypothetical protein MOGMAGMI_01495 [Candidatus Omnitrophica bacterium]|nr:hypothetical protein [Candidatus Omnitrophota bacterium]
MFAPRGRALLLLAALLASFPAPAASATVGSQDESFVPASGASAPVEDDAPLAGKADGPDTAAGEPAQGPAAQTRRVRVSGSWRVAAGVNSREVIWNESNADLQERNFRFIFGEDLANTYDPGIYSRALVNVEADLTDQWGLYAQAVADPWSVVGTTGEQVLRSDIGGETLRYNLKYFGAFNGVLNETFRTDNGDAVTFPLIEVEDGRTVPTVVRGFNDFNPGTNGIPFSVPEHEIDYEFRPLRKLWIDHRRDDWHARFFALADESQALTTDDPLGLSNHRDYWQQSPWLYQYEPVRHFSDGSIKRGYYSDTLSFLARDSDGNRLVLLRGVSVEADLGRTYVAGTVASPYTPWDEDYLSGDNVPAAVRIKHYATEDLLVGGTYTFRSGLVNESVADLWQAGGVDAAYRGFKDTTLTAQMAVSNRQREINTDDRLRADSEGLAYHLGVERRFDRGGGRKGEGDEGSLRVTFTQMDREFQTPLSRYSNTRDDRYWGKYLSFDKLPPDLEPFRLGDGVDHNRTVVRVQWREKLFMERFENLFDARQVNRTDGYGRVETVVRDEVTWRWTDRLVQKGLVRWQGLPRTDSDTEPFISSFYFLGEEDPSELAFQNAAIDEGLDPSRWTFSTGLQYLLNDRWTLEGTVERSNDIPDFPRGLLNSTFRDANRRVDGILIERLTSFLYGQEHLGAVPPYDHFTIWRQKAVWRPDPKLRVIFHAAQNSYRLAGPIDDNLNHAGVSIGLDPHERLQLFFDYTRSRMIDVARLISSGYADRDDTAHNNFYASCDWRLNARAVLRAEYGVFGLGSRASLVTPYSTGGFSLPVLDTEHLLRLSLSGDF